MEFDGDRYHNLFIYGAKTDPDRDRYKNDPNTVFYGRGNHTPGLISLKDGQTLYVDDGAIVYGRVEITGSGAYLDNAVRSVLYDCGVREYSLYRGGNEAAIISRVLSLPDVTFCSVQKRGSVLYVDVQTNTESGTRADSA